MDWASSKDGKTDDNVSGFEELSLNTEALKTQLEEKEEKITYAVLLDHIENADRSYEQIRKQGF